MTKRDQDQRRVTLTVAAELASRRDHAVNLIGGQVLARPSGCVRHATGRKLSHFGWLSAFSLHALIPRCYKCLHVRTLPKRVLFGTFYAMQRGVSRM